jgi:hypothetical protein
MVVVTFGIVAGGQMAAGAKLDFGIILVRRSTSRVTRFFIDDPGHAIAAFEMDGQALASIFLLGLYLTRRFGPSYMPGPWPMTGLTGDVDLRPTGVW